MTDALGSTLALTDTAGTVQTEYTYEPFGKATTTGTANSNSFQYTGRENDNTGLYYYRARFYSPLFQRFISEDPIFAPLTPLSVGICRMSNFTIWLFPNRLRIPEFSDLNQSLNPYVYVINNSLRWTDPKGLDPNGPPPCQAEIQQCIDATRNIPTRQGGTVGDCIEKGMKDNQYCTGRGTEDRVRCTGANFASVTAKCFGQANTAFETPDVCRADVMVSNCR